MSIQLASLVQEICKQHDKPYSSVAEGNIRDLERRIGRDEKFRQDPGAVTDEVKSILERRGIYLSGAETRSLKEDIKRLLRR